MTQVLEGLPPLVSASTRLLILGSFPSAASLGSGQYYGHPRNQFWRILEAVWPASPLDINADSYEKRSNWLLDRKLGLWDVYASCQRQGSLDSSIRKPALNDFGALIATCPELVAIAHNGAQSFKHAALIRGFGLPSYLLPSTSPAHAAMSFADKLAAWSDLFRTLQMTTD